MTPLLSDNAPRAPSRSATRAQYAYNMHNTPLLSLENGQAFTQNTPSVLHRQTYDSTL